jgi:hypothetical protein
MSSEIDPIGAKYEPFNEATKEFAVLLSIARHDSLQRAALQEIDRWRQTITGWKREAIAARSEDQANYCLGLECICNFFSSELEMWLLLKDRKPDDAWGKLIEAQNAVANALRAHRSFSDWDYHVGRLQSIEELVFPPQNFVSAGLRVKRQICSLCGEEYEDCPHLVGIPYWGEFCWRILQDFTADHIAFTDTPANKRCRVTYIHLDEGKRNKMTWEIEPYSEDELKKRNGLEVDQRNRTFDCSILHLDDLKV